MADKKISALTASTTPLAGTEVLPIVQSSSTVKVSVANLTAGRAVSMLSNTMVSASAVNDVDKTGGAGYSYRMKGNDQDNVRFRVENTGGQIYEIVGGNPGASNAGFAIFDATASATRMYIGSTGDITANTGNVIIGTAAKGIDFSANTNLPGMTSELLNYYEEGNWTPSFSDLTVINGTGGVTYSGKYVKVGALVKWQATIAVTGTATTASAGTTRITNLPFAPASFDVCAAANGSNGTSYGNGVLTGGTIAYMPAWGATNSIIVISGSYQS